VILSRIIKLKAFVKIDFFLRFSLIFQHIIFFITFQSNAQVADITRWTFISNPFLVASSTPGPEFGIGSSGLVGSMTGATNATGPDTGCNGNNESGSRSWQIGTANPGTTNESSGVQFKASTVGYENIQFTWDQRFSNTSTRTVRVQYTIDGINWINLTLDASNFLSGCSNRNGFDDGRLDVSNIVGTNVSDAWARRTILFTSISGVNNNPDFGVRILAAHYSNTGQFRQANNSSTVAPTSGTWRFDNVAFQGTSTIVNPSLPFESCNLLVYRVGDGSLALNTSAVPVSLLEVNKLSGAIVQTLSSPFLSSNLLTQSGAATSNGNLNSYNNLVAVPGHNSANGTLDVNQQNTKVTTILDASAGVLNRYTHPSSTFDSDNYRSAIPLTSTTFYASGNGNGTTKGIFYFDGTNFNQVINLNTRNIEIFNGQLYYSTASASSGNIGIYALGSGLPMTASTATPFITYPATNGSGPYGFSISPDGCTAYLADDGSTNYPGISKWTKDNGGNWNFQYSNSTQARGLVVDYSGIYPILYITTTETNENKIIKITDSGSLSVATTLLTSGTNYLFRGIDFTPNSNAAITISQQPQAKNVCETEATSISVSAASSVSLTYQWYSNSIDSYCGASPVSGATSSTFSPPVSNSGTTYYFVKIVSLCSSIVFSNRVAVIVNELVNPIFTSISAICPGGNFTLPTSSTNSISGIWSPSNNTNETTNYVFTPNVGQCANSTSMTVQVYKAPKILALSPP
jgi:hypothetical protein